MSVADWTIDAAWLVEQDVDGRRRRVVTIVACPGTRCHCWHLELHTASIRPALGDRSCTRCRRWSCSTQLGQLFLGSEAGVDVLPVAHASKGAVVRDNGVVVRVAIGLMVPIGGVACCDRSMCMRRCSPECSCQSRHDGNRSAATYHRAVVKCPTGVVDRSCIPVVIACELASLTGPQMDLVRVLTHSVRSPNHEVVTTDV